MMAAISPVRTSRGPTVSDMCFLCSCTARVEPVYKKLRILLNLSRLIQAPLRKDATGSPCRVHSHAEVADSIVAARSFHAAFFFFQAEDGIRDLTVTGVQTCALPI